MANDINSVVLIGNIVRDVGDGFAYAQNGNAVAKISIAVNRAKKQSDGSWGNEVSYFDVNIWGKTAENLKPYLVKGQKIAIDGYLKQDRWTDKNGNNASRVVINADNVELVGGKGNTNGQPQKQSEPFPQANDGGFQEDIPF